MSERKRIEVVDAIRGIAVAMIILLHSIEHFNYYNMPTPDSPWLAFADQMIWDSLWFMVGGKAYAIFALLFGFSFYIMYSNAEKRGVDFRGRFCWRLVLLFLFGNLNAAFFCGEVLVLYSIVGFVLPLVCRLRTRTVLIIAAVCMLQPLEWIKMAYATIDPDASILVFSYGDCAGKAFGNIAGGGFLDTLKTNLWEGQIFSLLWAWANARFFQTASLMMLGMVAGRMNWFADTEENRHLWRRTFAVALCVFLPLYGLASLIPDFAAKMTEEQIAGSSLGIITVPSFNAAMMLIITSLHKFAFMLMLVTGMLFLFYSTSFRRPMERMMPYGRMSLTNYIMQSIIGSFLFYNWGLGLIPCDTYSVLIGICILCVQLLFCTWWMKGHRRGPLEELWHKGTWIFCKRNS